MLELELVGLHSDGEHLTLAGPDGQRYRLLVDDALRAAVRRDRPQLEQIRAGEGLRPKEIQARIRAGATAQEVAEAAGLPVEHVQRYEGPVLAERSWVVEQARRFTVGRAEDSPELGDLVLDRLAVRDVADVTWDAVREPERPWELVARFTAGGRPREARWEVDMAARSTRALDDEARWLSETDVAPGPPSRRHLMPVRLYDVEADGDLGPAIAAVDADLTDTSPEDLGFGDLPAASTDDLLAELRATRGTRPELETGLEDELPPPAHPPASRPHEAVDAQVLPLPRDARPAGDVPAAPPSALSPERPVPPPERTGTRRTRAEAPGGAPDRPAARTTPRGGQRREPEGKEPKRRRGRRASVPSWDEIVFGAKPE
ncbi:MAG TPA: septation protein SepH [Actinomycetaceae bacterium]|nr:septation protein SepH [Actinomycetaceae bacterium]